MTVVTQAGFLGLSLRRTCHPREDRENKIPAASRSDTSPIRSRPKGTSSPQVRVRNSGENVLLMATQSQPPWTQVLDSLASQSARMARWMSRKRPLLPSPGLRAPPCPAG